MSFDTLAPYYRWMELILAGQKMHRCRTAFLDQILRAKNILLLGEGHGRALTECRRRFPTAQITCLDASQGMLQAAQKRVTSHGLDCDRIKIIHADALTWQPPAERYDLIATQFFFDCFHAEQIKLLVDKLAGSLNREGNWLIADFQIPRKGIQRMRSRLIVWSLYQFFRIMTRLPARFLAEPDQFLAAAGLQLNRRVETEWGLLRSDWWQPASRT